jgi:hypothetical protein
MSMIAENYIARKESVSLKPLTGHHFLLSCIELKRMSLLPQADDWLDRTDYACQAVRWVQQQGYGEDSMFNVN